MRKASIVHGRANVEALERAARTLLGYPCLPDGVCGVPFEQAERLWPDKKAVKALREIREDVATMGEAAAIKKHAALGHGVTTGHACALDDDPAWLRAASGRTIAHLEHPTRKGEYHFPDTERLQQALANPTARSRCSAQALAALDGHAAKVGPLPADWVPPKGPAGL